MSKVNKNSYSALVAALRARASLTPGAERDLKRCFSPASQFFFSEQTAIDCHAYGIDFAQFVNLPQKQIFRFVGFINALRSKTLTDFDYTHARILCAMRLAGAYQLTTDAVEALAAGKRATTANLRGVSSSNINRIFSHAHRMSTVKTKVSNMTGINGFSQLAGMTWGEPGKNNHTLTLNEKSPLVIRFFEVIDGATVGQIEEMIESGSKPE